MADIVFIVVVVVFFAFSAALVKGCDRIVRSDVDGPLPEASPEVVS